MLIKRLEVKGFKSLKDVVWEPGPLTILIGPNGSGKTNLLYCLELLKRSSKGNLDAYIQSIGGIYSIFWDGQETTILLNADIDFSNSFLSAEIDAISYRIQLKTFYWNNTYDITGERLVIQANSNNNSPQLFLHRDDQHSYLVDNRRNKIFFTPSETSYNPKESILSKALATFETTKFASFSNYCFNNQQIFWCITTSKDAEIRRPLITRFDKTLNTDGQNLVNVLHTLYSENREFENNINTAMQAAFGDDFDRLVFPPAADQLVQLRIRWKSLKREQSMLDLSDGTIRFLFLMTVLCNPDPPSLIAIDEPETGLHPSMFPIIAEYAAEASKRTQVIFSTHSPQFLDAFGDYNPTTTVTAWKDGETKIKNLDGEALQEWLKHYSLGTLFLSGDLEAMV